MMTAAIILLSLALLAAATYCILLKNDIRSISRSLEAILKAKTNARVTTQTFDADISRLAMRINTILEAQNQAELAGEKIDRELRQAITNVSHDLKTPLTSATGYLQMIASDKISPDKKVEYLRIVEQRLDTLSDLLDDLFEFSKIAEGKVDIDLARVNAANLLRDVLSLYYEDFSRKNITPQASLPNEPVYVLADANLLKRVIQNLVQNALVHGTEYFSVGVEPDGRLIFKNSVANPEQIDAGRLFERFYTGDISRSSKTTGLGLAICKELVERQNGKIEACVEANMLIIIVRMSILV